MLSDSHRVQDQQREYHSLKNVKDHKWNAYIVASRQSLRGFHRASDVFHSHILKLLSQTTRNCDGRKTLSFQRTGSNAEWSFFFSAHTHRAAVARTTQNTTKGKSLALRSSSEHLGPRLKLLPTGTKGIHTQSNVKHGGGRENASQSVEARTKHVLWWWWIWECHSGKGRARHCDTTHILQRSPAESTCNNAATLLPSPQPPTCLCQHDFTFKKLGYSVLLCS